MNYNIISNTSYIYILESFENELLDNWESNKKLFMLHDPINLILLYYYLHLLMDNFINFSQLGSSIKIYKSAKSIP